MKLLTRFACVLAALSLIGCYPEERIWWSPKGDRAIVAMNDQLRLVTAEGERSAPLLGGASIKDWLIKTLDWLPDGTGFVCSRRRYVPTFAEVKKLIPVSEAERIEAWLPMVLPALGFQIARVKNPADITGLQGLIPGNDKALFEAGLRVLFERQRTDVEKVLRTVPHGEELLDELADPRGMFSVIELCVVKLDASQDVAPKGIAWGLLDPVFMPKVSPKHDAIAFLQLYDNRDAPDLKVMSLDGKTSLDVAQQISSGGFEWMADGRTLVFASALSQPGDSLQSIQQLTVLQESGALMRPAYDTQQDGSQVKGEGADRLAEMKLLALAILPGRASLHPLPDGRILFASQPITLPAVGAKPKLEPLLHLIAADGQSVSTVPTAPGDLPTDLNYMVVSPDGKHVAVVEEATDAVAVVEVSTGKTEIISEAHPNWKCETMPAWKSATELTFAALDDKTHVPCWMLWPVTGGKRSLSSQWPAADTRDWLVEQKSSSFKKSGP